MGGTIAVCQFTAAAGGASFDGHLEKPMSAEMLARVLHRAGWKVH